MKRNSKSLERCTRCNKYFTFESTFSSLICNDCYESTPRGGRAWYDKFVSELENKRKDCNDKTSG